MIAKVDMTEGNLNLSDIPRAMASMQDQVPKATALALTRLAQDSRKGVQDHMRRKLDRPTRRTIRGVRFKPAEKEEEPPTASVWIVDEAPKGTAPADYLEALIQGGQRDHKRHEKALHRAGILPPGWYTVPGQDARKNKFSNITAGTYTKILSELQASPDPQQNASDSRRSVANNRGFFVLRRGESRVTSGRPIGVYQRTGKRRGSIKSILHFISFAPTYKETLDISGTIDDVLQKQTDQNVSKAIETVIRSETERRRRRQSQQLEASLRALQKRAAQQAFT